MDFWDITKLLFRRWIILLPMLALSGSLSVVAILHVKPDYVAHAYVQLVPPVSGPTTAGQATPDQRNPWLGLGLQTLGNASLVTVNDLSVVDQLKAAGYSDSYTITMEVMTPLVDFEVVGKSVEQAKDSTEQLIERFNASVKALQAAYGVTETDMITTRRLDMGTNITKSQSKVKRAGIAIAAAGVLFTVAVTVAADAWLRRRSRRKALAAQAVEPIVEMEMLEVVSAPPAPVARSQPGKSLPGPAPAPVRPPSGMVELSWSPSSDTKLAQGSLVPGSKVGSTYPTNGKPPATEPAVASDMDKTQVLTRQREDDPAEAEAEAPEPEPLPSDATIVLPVTVDKERWTTPRGRDGKG